MTINNFLSMYGYKLPTSAIKQLKTIKDNPIKQRNWLLLWSKKLDIQLKESEAQYEQELAETKRELSELSQELRRGIIKADLFYKVMRKEYDKTGSLKDAAKEVQQYAECVTGLKLKDHVNKSYLRLKAETHE